MKNIFIKIKRAMITAMLLCIFMMPIKSYAPQIDDSIIKETNKYIIENQVLTKNLNLLKDSSLKTRKEVFELVQPIIEIYLKRGEYHNCFPNLDSVSYAISCIFVSESSNHLGQSARSTLWLSHNNPFGITSSRGKTYKSWEMIDGKRVIMNRTFCTYNSFSDAIDSLMSDCLLKNSYTLTANSQSVKEFLFNLHRNKYMTNKNWPKFAYEKIYLMSIKENKKEKMFNNI